MPETSPGIIKCLQVREEGEEEEEGDGKRRRR